MGHLGGDGVDKYFNTCHACLDVIGTMMMKDFDQNEENMHRWVYFQFSAKHGNWEFDELLLQCFTFGKSCRNYRMPPPPPPPPLYVLKLTVVIMIIVATTMLKLDMINGLFMIDCLNFVFAVLDIISGEIFCGLRLLFKASLWLTTHRVFAVSSQFYACVLQCGTFGMYTYLYIYCKIYRCTTFKLRVGRGGGGGVTLHTYVQCIVFVPVAGKLL